LKKRSLKEVFHIGFDIGLILKSLFAAGEVLGGIAMTFVTPEKLNRLIAWITAGESSEGPHDWLVNYLITFGHRFTLDAQQFASFYLLSHGLVKLVVLFLLWKKKLWAYPLSIAVFVGFIIYQMVRFANSYSIMMLFLTFLDMVMIFLTIMEYRNLSAKNAEQKYKVQQSSGQ